MGPGPREGAGACSFAARAGGGGCWERPRRIRRGAMIPAARRWRLSGKRLGRRAAAWGDSAPAGGSFHGGCAPHSLFVLDKKRMRRARWIRKNRFWSQLCTSVQSCCTGVDERWCLRVCDDLPTGAAGCGTGLNADSRGAGVKVNGVQGRIWSASLSARSAALRAAGFFAVAKREAAPCDDHPDDLRTIRHGTAVTNLQKGKACPKAGQNRRLHRSADPRRAEARTRRSASKRSFLLDRARPVFFSARPKRKWGVHCPAIIIAAIPRPMGRTPNTPAPEHRICPVAYTIPR